MKSAVCGSWVNRSEIRVQTAEVRVHGSPPHYRGTRSTFPQVGQYGWAIFGPRWRSGAESAAEARPSLLSPEQMQYGRRKTTTSQSGSVDWQGHFRFHVCTAQKRVVFTLFFFPTQLNTVAYSIITSFFFWKTISPTNPNPESALLLPLWT